MSVIYGAERLKSDLEALGFAVATKSGLDSQPYCVIIGFEVPAGRFGGRIIDLGVMAVANYPQGVASAIQVKADPQLFETGDSLSGVRNIQASPLGTEWRYWSKNLNWDGEKTTRRLISQINRIFDDA